MSIQDKLNELGIELPVPNPPVANYVAFVQTGNLISISGQVSMGADVSYTGKIGQDVTVEEGAKAARLCAINILSQINAALDGNLERVKRVVRLGGFVNCVDGFGDQPEVINGASDLMVDVFGDKGRHSRAAVGVNALPRNVAVEIDALFEVE